MRVSSNLDLMTNTIGTAAGALLGWAAHGVGAVDRWQATRERWFIPHSAGGLALLALWPLGLLFPAPVPLGLGHVTGRLVEGLGEALEGRSWRRGSSPGSRPSPSTSRSGRAPNGSR